MTGPDATRRVARVSRTIRLVRGWTFWTLNAAARRYLAAVEVLAAALVCLGLVTGPVDLRIITRCAVLLGLGLGYTELASRVDQLKRYLGAGTVRANQTSVWAFAAALLLPAGFAGLLVALSYAHLLLLRRHSQSVRPHRALFSAATTVLATMVSAYLIDSIAGSNRLADTAATALAATAGVAVFPLVNLAGLLGGMYLVSRPRQLRQLLPGRDEVGFEVITILLGIVAAEFVAHAIWLTPVVLALVATAHRSSLVKDLRAAATTDPKTGLLNAAAWRDRARQGLSLAGRDAEPVAVLLVDLDHFKVVNDTRGHLVGDQVLARVPGRCATRFAATTRSGGSAARNSSSSCTARPWRRRRRWPNGCGPGSRPRRPPRVPQLPRRSGSRPCSPAGTSHWISWSRPPTGCSTWPRRPVATAFTASRSRRCARATARPWPSLPSVTSKTPGITGAGMDQPRAFGGTTGAVTNTALSVTQSQLLFKLTTHL